MRQRITHRFYDVLHHVPVYVWGWNPSVIMVAHMHFSVNTTIDMRDPFWWCTVTLACVCVGARGVAEGSGVRRGKVHAGYRMLHFSV